MPSILKLLENIGLSGNEASVYLATIKLGSGTSEDIAHAAKLQRTTTKSILERLQQKGFVSLQKSRSKHIYWIEDPKVVLNKENARLDLIKEIFSQINYEYKTTDRKPKVEVFDTREGIITLISKVINETKKGDEILTFESPSANNYQKVMTNELFQALSKQKITKGIQTRVIIPLGESKQIRPSSLKFNVTIRELPDNLAFTSSIWIFGKSIGFFSGNQIFAVIIKHEEMHDSFSAIFNFLWSMSKKI